MVKKKPQPKVKSSAQETVKISVWVKAGASQEKIEQIDDSHFLVWTKEPAKEDKANKRVQDMLAEFLGVPPSLLVLKKGRHFQEKLFELE